jgi:hypothetical protein
VDQALAIPTIVSGTRTGLGRKRGRGLDGARSRACERPSCQGLADPLHQASAPAITNADPATTHAPRLVWVVAAPSTAPPAT